MNINNYEDEIYFEKNKKFYLRNKNKEKNYEKKCKNLLIVSTRQSTKRLNEKNTINNNETSFIKNNNIKFNHKKKKSFSSTLNIYEKSKKEKILFEKKILNKKNELLKLELSNSKRNFKISKSSQNILNKINYTSIFKRVNKINSLDTKLLKFIIEKENNNINNFKKTKNKNNSFEKFLFNNTQTLRNKEKKIKQINKLNKEDEYYDLKEYTFHPIINKKNLSFKNDNSYNLNINKSNLKKHIIKNNEEFNFKPKINNNNSNKTLIENYSQKNLNNKKINNNEINNNYFIECKNVEILNPFLQIQTISELTEESQKYYENSPIKNNNNNFIYKRKIISHKSRSEGHNNKIYNINTSKYLPNNNFNKKENLNIIFLNLNNKNNLSILNDLL